MTRAATLCLIAVVLAAATGSEAAEVAPPSPAIPNYNNVLLGQRAALEGGACRARVADPDANWYNPAGLVRVGDTSLSASVSALQYSVVELKGDGVEESTDSIGLVPTFFAGARGPTPEAPRQQAFGYSLAMPLYLEQSIDSDRSFKDATSVREYVWNTQSDLETLAPGMAMGWRLTDRLSWGAGATICRTALETVSNSSTHVIGTAFPYDTTTLIQDQAINAEVYHLRFSAGAQFRPTDGLALGLALRSPGIRLGDSGSFTIQGLAASDDVFLDVSSRLTDLRVDYMMPFEAGFGVAYTGKRYEIELDVTCHAGLGKFAVFRSDGDVRFIAEALGIFFIVPADFPTSYTYHKSVVNFSIGGRYQLKESLWLHGGFYTDFSPVRDADDPVFKKIDMFGLTLGLTQEGPHHAFTIGLGYAFGESEEFEIDDIQSTEPVDVKLVVQTLNVMVGATFKF